MVARMGDACSLCAGTGRHPKYPQSVCSKCKGSGGRRPA